MAPPGPMPVTAFGFILDEQYRRRWAQDFLDNHYDPDGKYRASESPKQLEDTLLSAMIVMNSAVAAEVYKSVPDLIRLRRRLLPMKEAGSLIPRKYVFVLHEGGPTQPTAEHIEQVRKALKLKENQEPSWVPIDREMC